MTDDWDDEYDDDLEDFDDDDPSAWYECPLCGEEVYDDANLCPSCDQYMVPQLVTRSDSRPMWYLFLVTAGILAVIVTVSGLISLL
jgi:hypothetical protein